MGAFIIRRLIGLVLVLFAISVMTFLIFFATPGVDPARQLAGRNPDPSTIAAVRHQFGLDRPLPIRYALMMKRLFISRDLVSYGNQALKVVPAITSATPITMLPITQSTAAPITSEKSTGAALVIAGTTFSAWLPYETRSREMKSRFIISA